MDLDARARQRRAELWLGISWYSFSAFVTVGMTTANSALSVLPGYESWALWTGRFALVPFLLAVGGFAWLVRGPLRARRVVDEQLAPRIGRTESLLAFAAGLVVPAVAWVVQPGIGPGILGLSLLWGTLPLLWSALRVRSAAWPWLLGLAVYGGINGLVLLGLRWWYGPVTQATGRDLDVLLLAVGGVATLGLLFGFGTLAVLSIGFIRVDRAFDRGELDQVAATSFAGLLEDHLLVLDALRRMGRIDELLDRYARSVGTTPITSNSLAVVARALHDRDDPRALPLALAAFDAQPTSPSALLTLGLVYLDRDPGVSLDAATTALARALGGSSRRGVFEALEIVALAALGQDVTRRLDTYTLPAHPVHRVDAQRLLERVQAALN